MHPQYLKQYNNRWFVFGTHSKYNPVTTLAVDRISYIEEVNAVYEVSDIDFTERYEDIIGITRAERKEPVRIELQANTGLASYILTKPLHGSQKNGVINEAGLQFSIEVIPNYELEEQILAYGEAIKVISPPEFVMKIKERIRASLDNY